MAQVPAAHAVSVYHPLAKLRQTASTSSFVTQIENGVLYSPRPKVSIPVCSIYTAVKKFLSAAGHKTAAVDYTKTYSRQALLHAIERYAAGFQSLGVKAGEHVCVHLRNSVDSFVAVFALIFAGATVVLCDTSLTNAELRTQMTNADAEYVVTDPQNADKMRAVCDEMKVDVKKRFVLGDAPDFISLASFDSLDEKEFRAVDVADTWNSVAAICYTSGATGMAKAIEITHYSFVANLIQNRSVAMADETDVFLAWNPIMHTSGFLFTMLSVCIGSTCIIVSPTVTVSEFVDICTKYTVTALYSFPGRLYSLVQQMKASGTCVDSMRKLCVGGGPVNESLARHVLDAFPKLCNLRNLYGLVECGGLLTSPGLSEINCVDVGFPTPNVELKFVRLNTRKPAGPNVPGEIAFRTPSAMRGYYKNAKRTDKVLEPNGWCLTGDVGYYDESGRVYLVERVHELVRCMDNRVVPEELEALILQSFPAVAEVGVVGLPHHDYGEAAAAFVVLREGEDQQITGDDIMRVVAASVSCRDGEVSLAKHKHLIGGVYFPRSLPHTETGRVLRSALRNDPSYRVERKSSPVSCSQL